MNKKAVVAMSGGVDSSVAAYLIKCRGYEAAGITLKLLDGGPDLSDDAADARAAADKLGIKHYVVDFSGHFDEQVLRRFVSAYTAGSTPNPCIFCNKHIKFGHLMFHARQLGYDCLVTGHYAVVGYHNNRYFLKRAADQTKDQSYVLYSLTQEQLSRIVLPLGGLLKSEVREIAAANGLTNAQRKESQDICFVKNGSYAEFIEQYTGKKFDDGLFVNKQGEVLGRHKGIIRYTVGQHKGLGISSEEPYYVTGFLPGENRIILGRGFDLYSKSLEATSINLIALDRIETPLKLKARIRYRQKEQDAVAEQIGEDRLRIEFDEPQRAITKGQSVVLYDGDYIVGGGIIS